MAQKIIKIGSSQGITIPKKQLEEMGLKVGDSVECDIKPAKKKLRAFSVEVDDFMKTYEEDLKNLANR